MNGDLARTYVVQPAARVWAAVQRACTWASEHPYIVLALVVLGAALVRLPFVRFGAPTAAAGDSLLYLVKSLEILRGDWTPMLTHAYGLSIAAAPFLALFGGSTFASHIAAAQAFAVIVAALLPVPAYLLAREYLGRGGAYAVALLVAVDPFLIELSQSFMSDLLFAHLVLFALLATVKSRHNVRYGYVAAAIGGLAYYVRANGIFILAAILLTTVLFRLRDRKWLLVHLAAMTAVFLLVATPMLVARAQTFGSPFTYGENDKIFVDSYTHDVWAPNIPAPTLGAYLTTHSFVALANRFVVKGLVKTLLALVEGMAFGTTAPVVASILLLPALYGVAITLRTRAWWPVYAFGAVFVGGTAVVFAIFTGSRFLAFFAPVAAIAFMYGIRSLTAPLPHRTFVRAVAVVVVAAVSLLPTTWSYAHRPAVPPSLPQWAVWTGEHVRGTLLALERGDYAVMSLPDVHVGGNGLYGIDAPTSGLRIRRYGQFPTLVDALVWHVAHDGATDLLVTDGVVDARPYLRDAPAAEAAGLLQLLYEDRSSAQGDVRVYAIDRAALSAFAASTTPESV